MARGERRKEGEKKERGRRRKEGEKKEVQERAGQGGGLGGFIILKVFTILWEGERGGWAGGGLAGQGNYCGKFIM